VHGRKLVGSAQRRFVHGSGGEVVLQHGSILLGPDHLRIVEFLSLPDDETRGGLRRELEEKTTDLSSVLGRRVDFGEVAASIKQGFEECWGIRFQEAEYADLDFELEVPSKHATGSSEAP
jgi:lipoate-protein ligase A